MSENSEYFYNLSHLNSRIALIFNQYKFDDGSAERRGSLRDTEEWKQVLLEWGFDVRVFMDLTVEGIQQTMYDGEW